jgi:hypothetical protein
MPSFTYILTTTDAFTFRLPLSTQLWREGLILPVTADDEMTCYPPKLPAIGGKVWREGLALGRNR